MEASQRPTERRLTIGRHASLLIDPLQYETRRGTVVAVEHREHIGNRHDARLAR
jgi:hypothetical protein